MAKKLGDLAEFIELSQLLDLNRPSTAASNGMKFGADAETNAFVATPDVKRE